MPRVRGYFTEVILMSSLRIRSKYAVYTDALSSTHFTYDRPLISFEETRDTVLEQEMKKNPCAL